MAIRHSLWAGVVAMTATTMVATTVTPPPLSDRDKAVAFGAAVELSAAQTEIPSTTTVLADPAAVSEGLHLVAAVSARTEEQRTAALTPAAAADVPATPDNPFGDGSLSAKLAGLYQTGGLSAVVSYVSLTLSDAIFGEDSLPSQMLGEYFDGGPQAVVAYATLAVADAVFGEDSFASGLVTAWFYGYPFDEDGAQGAYAGVVHYVIDTIKATVEPDGELPVDPAPGDEPAGDDATFEASSPTEESTSPAPGTEGLGTATISLTEPGSVLDDEDSPGLTAIVEESEPAEAPAVDETLLEAETPSDTTPVEDTDSMDSVAVEETESTDSVAPTDEDTSLDDDVADDESSDEGAAEQDADEKGDEKKSDESAKPSDSSGDADKAKKSDKSDKSDKAGESGKSDGGDSE